MQNINQYSFLQKKENRSLSLVSALKPLNIGSINNIINMNSQYVRGKIDIQLKRLNDLVYKLNDQINNPKYAKVQGRNRSDLKFLHDAILIHKTYFNKVLYYKNKTMNMDAAYLENLQKIYTNRLFMLNQLYQRNKLQMKGVDLSGTKNPIRDDIQFSNL